MTTIDTTNMVNTAVIPTTVTEEIMLLKNDQWYDYSSRRAANELSKTVANEFETTKPSFFLLPNSNQTTTTATLSHLNEHNRTLRVNFDTIDNDNVLVDLVADNDNTTATTIINTILPSNVTPLLNNMIVDDVDVDDNVWIDDVSKQNESIVQTNTNNSTTVITANIDTVLQSKKSESSSSLSSASSSTTLSSLAIYTEPTNIIDNSVKTFTRMPIIIDNESSVKEEVIDSIKHENIDASTIDMDHYDAISTTTTNISLENTDAIILKSSTAISIEPDTSPHNTGTTNGPAVNENMMTVSDISMSSKMKPTDALNNAKHNLPIDFIREKSHNLNRKYYWKKSIGINDDDADEDNNNAGTMEYRFGRLLWKYHRYYSKIGYTILKHILARGWYPTTIFFNVFHIIIFLSSIFFHYI